MLYKIITTVKSVELVEKTIRGRTILVEGQKTAVFDTETLGWYVHFDGSWEKLYFGKEKPDLMKGQKVEITIRGL